MILATQVVLLPCSSACGNCATATDKQTAFMFGSPSAILGFLAQMSRDGSLWRDTYVTGP